MGTNQILRAAEPVALAILVTFAGLLGVGSAQASTDDSAEVLVIDLRADAAAHATTRAQLVAALASEGVPVLQGAEVDAALSGTAFPQASTDALAQAAATFGALDCAATTIAADTAIVSLAAQQAAGDPTAVPGLVRAWTYHYLCADRSGDHAALQRAGVSLRALGVVDAKTIGVTPATWQATPAIDASTDRSVIKLHLDLIRADGSVMVPDADAMLWIDHVPVGKLSSSVFVAAGEHVIAVASGNYRFVGLRANVVEKTRTLTLAEVTALAQPTTALAVAANAVTLARGEKANETVRTQSITAALRAMNAERAVVLRSATRAEIWRMSDNTAIKTATAPLAASRLVVLLQAPDDAEPPPLLVEQPGDGRGRYAREPTPTRWWVYATIAGALAAGATVLLIAGGGDDIQRIEVHGP